jgi:CheY-like chemotaxis protein
LAWSDIDKEPFELVIIDHLLPDMTGVELADAIKTASERVEQQIILLTSFDRDVGQIAARALGRLTKPIRQSALWDCIAVNAQPVQAVTSAPKKPAADQPGKGSAPVLVVEDSPVNLEVAVAILEASICERSCCRLIAKSSRRSRNRARLRTLRGWSRQSAKTIAPSKPDFRAACHRSPDSRPPNGEGRNEILAKDVFLTDAGVAPA